MKNFKYLLMGWLFITGVKAQAVGIHSSDLSFECEGEITLTKVQDIGVSQGFIDRAGKVVPAKGYAYVESMITHLSEGCEEMQETLGIDLKSKSLAHYFSFAAVDKKIITFLAEAQLGKTHSFQALQSYSYKDKDGYLPFFPLLHKESVKLKSATINFLQAANFKVDAKSVYDIYLSEEDKVLLADLVFHKLKSGQTNGLNMPFVVNGMMENHPSYSLNVTAFLDKIFDFFVSVEQGEYVGYQTFMLSTLGSNIRELSQKYVYKTAMDIPSVMVNHPSLLYYSQWQSSKAKCLNSTAIDLEEALVLLEEKLENGTIHSEVKKSWEKVLTHIAGNVFPVFHCLATVTSSLTKTHAQELLSSYY